MEENEKNFDKLLSQLVKEDAIETPSPKYTSMVMSQVLAHNVAEQKAKHNKHLVLLGLLIMCAVAASGVLLFFAWKLGWLAEAGTIVGNWAAPLLDKIPFEIPMGVLIVIVAHFVVSRIALTIMLYVRQKRVSWY